MRSPRHLSPGEIADTIARLNAGEKIPETALDLLHTLVSTHKDGQLKDFFQNRLKRVAAGERADTAFGLARGKGRPKTISEETEEQIAFQIQWLLTMEDPSQLGEFTRQGRANKLSIETAANIVAQWYGREDAGSQFEDYYRKHKASVTEMCDAWGKLDHAALTKLLTHPSD